MKPRALPTNMRAKTKEKAIAPSPCDSINLNNEKRCFCDPDGSIVLLPLLLFSPCSWSSDTSNSPEKDLARTVVVLICADSQLYLQ